MDISFVVRQRLSQLGLEQKDLAAAAQVTESYISQLLARKKAPPAPARTDIYDKMGALLGLPPGELAKLADLQRREEGKKRLTEPSTPLFEGCRELVLRKCAPERRKEVQRIVEREPFGELERMVTQKLLDVAQATARRELEREDRIRPLAERSGHTYEQMRVKILEFLDTDVFHVSIENSVAFLDPLIESWDIDLRTFSLEIVVDRRIAPGAVKRFEFVEIEPKRSAALEPGFEQFLKNATLSGDATVEEIEFLRSLNLRGKRPTALYYYRELQNLRDPLHFSGSVQPQAGR